MSMLRERTSDCIIYIYFYIGAVLFSGWISCITRDLLLYLCGKKDSAQKEGVGLSFMAQGIAVHKYHMEGGKRGGGKLL